MVSKIQNIELTSDAFKYVYMEYSLIKFNAPGDDFDPKGNSELWLKRLTAAMATHQTSFQAQRIISSSIYGCNDHIRQYVSSSPEDDLRLKPEIIFSCSKFQF